MSNSFRPYGRSSRLLCPWDSPGKNTGVGLPFPSWGNLIFPTRDRTWISRIEGRFSTVWATRGSLMVLLYFSFSTLGKSLNICMSSSFIFKMEIITYLPDQDVAMLKRDDTTSQCLEEWQVHCQCPVNFICYYDYLEGFSGGTSGKESPCQCRRHKGWGFDSWVGKICWRREWQPTPVFLPGSPMDRRSWGL